MHSDVTEREHHSPLSSLLAAVTRAVSRFPVLTLLVVLLLSTGAVTYTVKHLKFKTERADLIDPHADYQQNWLAYTKRFGDAADMVVVIEAKTPELFREAVDDLGARVDREPEHFANILYKVDTSALREKGIQYLSPDQLEELIGRLESFGPLLRSKWQLFNLKSVVRMLRFQVAQVAQAPDPQMSEPLLKMAASIVGSLDAFSRDGTQYTSPWENLVSFDGAQAAETQHVRYIVNEQGTFGFLFAQPAEGTAGGFDGATRVVERLRGLMAKTRAAVPGVTLKLTGIPVLESDEMRASQQAMFWASIISYLGVGVLLVIGFQGWKHPLLAMIMLAVAMAWAFAFTTGVVGHLNILSVSFVTILVGLGIDYSILFVTRYLELR
ncbi:MAG TPA: MMPL family transporter, partial [Planctomycetaceae bacterium]|nr:MMPL family transporter [Planctomycetaceae bacterium]